MLKVGLIGCGFMGAMHANCYKIIDGVELVALADIRRDKVEELSKGTNAKIYGDGKDLIENEDLDIIDICLPTFLHTEYAIKAMEKVKYLFIEKPVALTKEEGRKLIENAEKFNCNVQVGQVIRFWNEYVELRKIIESGKYGKIVNANFRRISPRPGWGWKDWLLDNKLSGGAAQDLHIHDIDYVLSVFGKPETYYSIKNTIGEKNSYINTLMKYNDFVVSVEGTWDLPSTYGFNATFRVVFENAVVEYSNGKLMLYTDDKTEVINIVKKQRNLEYRGGNISDLGGYINELEYFCNRAMDEGKIEQACLTDAVKSLEFLLEEKNF